MNGPYSATVEGTTTQLKNLGFLQESTTGFGTLKDGFEMRRYSYSLTDDGRVVVERLRATEEYSTIKQAADRILAAGHPNYVELSIAAKAYFLLKKQGGASVSHEELCHQAQSYNWSISAISVRKAVDFLSSLGLVREQKRAHHN